MTDHRSNVKHQTIAVWWLVALLVCAFGNTLRAQKVTLHLKDGDKIIGLIVSQDAKQVVISNAWVKALPVPLADISKRETNSVPQHASPVHAPAKKKARPPSKPAPKPAVKPTPKPPVKLPTKPKGKFHGQVQVGVDAIFNTRDQQSYFGNFKLTYVRPHQSNPKKFFRNTSQVTAEYQETAGRESANRAHGSNKSDFDIGKTSYAYGLVGGGYDDVRKIDVQYQLSPGMGTHLLRKKNFVLDVESGLDYEAQYRRDTSNLETFYLRLGADSTWSIRRNLKLTANVAFYPDFERHGQYHNQFTSSLSYGFWKNLSLNLTVVDDYNTEVAPGVDRNRFELRSTLGVTF